MIIERNGSSLFYDAFKILLLSAFGRDLGITAGQHKAAS